MKILEEDFEIKEGESQGEFNCFISETLEDLIVHTFETKTKTSMDLETDNGSVRITVEFLK